MTDHIIIGGGVIGLTLAYGLACQNESVVVLERGT
ncbi:FAD-dependent oxidoreductase, partial [uncultured Exiguobacterium sp.]